MLTFQKISMKAGWRQNKKIHQMMKECKGKFLYFEKFYLNFGSYITYQRKYYSLMITITIICSLSLNIIENNHFVLFEKTIKNR